MKFYIEYQGKETGPIELEGLGDYNITPTTRVYALGQGWDEMRAAADVPEIQSLYFAPKAAAKPTSTGGQWHPSAQANSYKQPSQQQPQQWGAQPQQSRQWGGQPQQAQQQPWGGQSQQPQWGVQPQQPQWGAPAAAPQGFMQPGYISPQAAPGVGGHSAVAEPAIWFIAVNDSPVGPLPLSALFTYNPTPSTLVWCDGMSDWAEAGVLQEFYQYFHSNGAQRGTPPPPPSAYGPQSPF